MVAAVRPLARAGARASVPAAARRAAQREVARFGAAPPPQRARRPALRPIPETVLSKCVNAPDQAYLLPHLRGALRARGRRRGRRDPSRSAPTPAHVATDGFGCVKGLKQHKLFDSPDRVRYPAEARRRRDWQRVSWEQALARDRRQGARAPRASTRADAIAMYVGTAAGFGVLHPVFAQGFMTGLGSKSMYASATQDCANKFAVARHVYGFPFTQPFPDVDHTECLIIVGANPVVSKWSFLQVSNPAQRLKEIEARGGQRVRRRSAPHRDREGRRRARLHPSRHRRLLLPVVPPRAVRAPAASTARASRAS